MFALKKYSLSSVCPVVISYLLYFGWEQDYGYKYRILIVYKIFCMIYCSHSSCWLQNSWYPSILQIRKLWQEELGESSKVMLVEGLQTQQGSLSVMEEDSVRTPTLWGQKKVVLFFRVPKHVLYCCFLSERTSRMYILLIGIPILSLPCFQGATSILIAGSFNQESWHKLSVLGLWNFFQSKLEKSIV